MSSRPLSNVSPASVDAGLRDLDEVVGGETFISPAKFMATMGLDITSFAKNAGVTPFTVVNAPHSHVVQEHLATNLRILRVALEIAQGDLPTAISWFKDRPLTSFGGKTAAALVAEMRTSDLMRLVEFYESGFEK